MYSSKNVAITLELGHKATVKGKKTNDGYTHDWEVFVQGGANSNIELFIEKIVFYLHESFQKPKRVLRAPPYKVSEVGYGCFTLPIEVYFKTNEEPRKAKFEYDLFLQSLDSPPISKIRREKLTFIKPNEEFKKKLLQSGGTEIQTLEESKVNEKSSKPRPSSGAKIKPTAPQSSSQSSTEICKKVKVESRKEVQKPKESDQFTALFGEIIKPQSSQKVRQIPKNSKEIEKGKNESLLKSKEKREKEKVGNSSLLPNSEIISTKKNKDKKENSKDRNNKVEKNREKDRKSIAKDVEKTHGKLKYKELEKEKSDGKNIAKETDSKKKALPSQEHQSVKKQRLKDGKSDDSKIEQEEEKNKHKHPKSKLTDEHKEISKISQKKDKCSEKHLKNAPNPHLPESTLGSKQSPKFTEYVTQRSPHISNPTERTRKEARFPQLQSNHSNAVSQASPHSNVHPSASSNPLNAQVNTSSSITKGNQGHVSKVPIQSHKSPIEERARSNSSSRSRSPILTLSSSSSPQRSLPSSRSSSPLESQKFRSRSVSRSRSRSTSKSNMGSYNSSRSRSRSPSTRFCSRSASRSRSESKSGNSSSSCDSSPSRSREPKRNRVGKGAINPLDILARDISESSSEGEDKLHSPPSKSSQESMMMPPSTASTVKSFQSLHKGKGKNDSRHKLVSSPKHHYATGTENVKCTEKNTLDSQKTVRPNFNANGMSECNNRAKDTKLSPLQEIPNDTESQPMPNPNESSPLYNIDPNYIDQLWELKNKIVTSFSDRAKVQEIVKIVSDATSYRINHSHFTFDLCSLDKQTINKLYQCLS